MTHGRAGVSVVLCTYNGARYLPEQLESLARQSLPPTQLVVRDDGSTDETASLVAAFAARAPFLVRWTCNAERLGPTRNFGAAIADATGEFVALCDQDDVWRPEKLERVVGVLAREPNAPFAFSDATVVDDALRPLGYSLWDSVRCTPDVRAALRHGGAFAALLRRNVVTGATLVFRTKHRDRVLPVPHEWIHDGWIALILSTLGAPVPVEAPLMLYRQHAANQVGARRRSLLRRVQSPRRYFGSTAREAERQFELLAGRLTEVGAPEARLAGDKVRFLRQRATLHSSLVARAPDVLRLQMRGEYLRYADGVRSALKDLFRPER